MRICGNCDYNDGCTYTSLPPQYKCTLTGKFHFGNAPCDVDFVPVVRCKDCKYYEQTDDDYEGEQGEDLWGVCRNTGAGMMRCGYCSDGERKDDD